MAKARLGLIGDNIADSKAPLLHALAGALQGFEVQYDLLVPAEVGLGFDALLDRCAQGSYRGINVTHPYKERAAVRVEIENSRVRAIGAVNLVRFDSGRKRGFNTDYSGFLAAWRAAFGAETPGIVCQVGAGGAGKAIGFALAELGADAIRLVDIDRDRARGLAGALRESYPELDAAAVPSLEEAAAGGAGFSSTALRSAWSATTGRRFRACSCRGRRGRSTRSIPRSVRSSSPMRRRLGSTP